MEYITKISSEALDKYAEQKANRVFSKNWKRFSWWTLSIGTLISFMGWYLLYSKSIIAIFFPAVSSAFIVWGSASLIRMKVLMKGKENIKGKLIKELSPDKKKWIINDYIKDEIGGIVGIIGNIERNMELEEIRLNKLEKRIKELELCKL